MFVATKEYECILIQFFFHSFFHYIYTALYTHEIGLDITCSHIAEISFNDVFQLTILMIINLAKHKCQAP